MPTQTLNLFVSQGNNYIKNKKIFKKGGAWDLNLFTSHAITSFDSLPLRCY